MAIKYLITLKASFNLLIHSYLLSFHFPIDYILIDKSTFVTISDSWVKDQETRQEIHWVFISLWLLWFDVFGHNICQQEIVVDICMGNILVLKNLASIIFVFNTLHPSQNITIWQKEEETAFVFFLDDWNQFYIHVHVN